MYINKKYNLELFITFWKRNISCKLCVEMYLKDRIDIYKIDHWYFKI